MGQSHEKNSAGPWNAYYDGEPGKIVCNESGEWRVQAIMAILFFGIGYYISLKMPFSDPRDDLMVYAVRGVFPVIGLGCLILGARAWIRNRKFGMSTFLIKNERGILGGTLSGVITSSVELHPKGDYKISLECVEQHVSTGTTRSPTKHVTLWSDKRTVPHATVNSMTGIPVEFSIPAKVPPSNSLEGNGQIQWLLRIAAPTAGLNYKAAFLVPVY